MVPALEGTSLRPGWPGPAVSCSSSWTNKSHESNGKWDSFIGCIPDASGRGRAGRQVRSGQPGFEWKVGCAPSAETNPRFLNKCMMTRSATHPPTHLVEFALHVHLPGHSGVGGWQYSQAGLYCPVLGKAKRVPAGGGGGVRAWEGWGGGWAASYTRGENAATRTPAAEAKLSSAQQCSAAQQVSRAQ